MAEERKRRMAMVQRGSGEAGKRRWSAAKRNARRGIAARMRRCTGPKRGMLVGMVEL
jgi:hypothetical protein